MAFTTPIQELIERNSNGLLGKHPSWERVRLGDVVTVQNGAAFKSEYFNTEGRGMPLLRIRDIVPGRTETWYDGPFDDDYIVQPGDLVIGMDGDFNHALWSGPPALLNQRVCRLKLRSDAVRLRFLQHILGGYLAAVNEATPSVTVKHLSSRTVADLLIPLPRLAAQDRIVERLEDILMDVEAGIAAFNRSLVALTQYRAACLAACFYGETQELGDLALIQSGIAKKSSQADGDVVEMPYIRTANVQALRLDITELKTLSVTRQQREKHALQAEDVLVLEGGDADKVGRGWIWSGEVPECLHQNHVFAVRPDQDLLNPRFLAYYINAPQARRYFLGVAKQTVNLASINKSNLRALPVPVRSLDEQRQTVLELDRQLSATTAVELDLQARLAQTVGLRRSLLQAAVTGQLVKPESSDRSASEPFARTGSSRHRARSAVRS